MLVAKSVEKELDDLKCLGRDQMSIIIIVAFAALFQTKGIGIKLASAFMHLYHPETSIIYT